MKKFSRYSTVSQRIRSFTGLTFRLFENRASVGSLGNGLEAWNAFNAKYNDSKEELCACKKQLVNF